MRITRRRFFKLVGATIGGTILACGGLGLWATRPPKLEYSISTGGDGKVSKRVLVVYDSVFGNTEKIARAMGDALAAQSEVTVARVGEVSQELLKSVDLLLVGGQGP